ncbi:sugar-phosphatase [Listeria ilorinensis]|uniref:sugar-phosphatase n=1 Tax=Listeria ilorinensis TaxID=2867439 RepID=UPI001EF68F95|nr:sugar-phosphatase [Listeria ilorinensis]
MYKLIAIDIDGTLLNDAHELVVPVIERIKAAKQAGAKVVLCSGRPLVGLRHSLEQLELLDAEDYAITMNGAIVLKTKTGEIVADSALDKEALQDIFAFCAPLGAHLTYLDATKMYVPHEEISILTCKDSLLLQTPLFYQPVDKAPNDIRIAKAMLLDEPEKIDEVVAALTKELQEKYYIVRSVPYNLEFLHKGVSKGTALKQLADSLGISRDEVMAIGDAENDSTMLEYAGMPVVMDNAAEHIKQLGKFITKTNNEAGVAYALEELVLK